MTEQGNPLRRVAAPDWVSTVATDSPGGVHDDDDDHGDASDPALNF
jgi:hypothetical protein